MQTHSGFGAFQAKIVRIRSPWILLLLVPVIVVAVIVAALFLLGSALLPRRRRTEHLDATKATKSSPARSDVIDAEYTVLPSERRSLN